MDLDIIARVAEKKIQEAIEEGKFDNLPGKGKPIVFTDDPMTPPHLRLANQILKNAGVLPDWVQVQKDVIAERQELMNLRARLLRENVARRDRLAELPPDHIAVRQFAEWHTKSRADYHRRLKNLNTLILKFSVMAPSTAQHFRPYKIDAEMAAFDAEFARLAQQPEVDVPPESSEPTPLYLLARTQYTRKRQP